MLVLALFSFGLVQVRLVSNRIFSTRDQNVEGDRQYTLLITFFGQWNDHDLSFTPMSPSIRSFSNGINCDDSCERSEPCFPIQVRKRFKYFKMYLYFKSFFCFSS